MSLTYGFFNSSNGDRKYNADQMSEYFDGLVSNGVYENVGDALLVTASEGLTVNVGTGRAIINCKWVKNSAALGIVLEQAHPTYNRYDAIVVRLNYTNRNFEITYKKGTAASSPEKPSMQRDATMYEICLAYVYVAAGATALTQADITDMRASSICGWITGLIEQVDTSTLFLQYQTAYENYYAEMTEEFDEWFSTLTDELQVDTYIQQFREHAELSTEIEAVVLDMAGYTYSGDDVIEVYINGLYGQLGVDYTIDTTGAAPVITTTAQAAGTEIDVLVLKSKIGFNTLVGSNGNIVTASNGDTIGIA